MEEYPVYCGSVCVGALQTEREGLYVRCRAVCGKEGQSVYRLWLCGTKRNVNLGIPEPHDKELRLERRCSAASLAAVGEIGYAFLEACGDTGDGWQTVCEPGLFFAEAALEQKTRHMKDMLWRRLDGRREMAIPFAVGERFPLPELICLARIYPVRGKNCAVFAANEEGVPIF